MTRQKSRCHFPLLTSLAVRCLIPPHYIKAASLLNCHGSTCKIGVQLTVELESINISISPVSRHAFCLFSKQSQPAVPSQLAQCPGRVAGKYPDMNNFSNVLLLLLPLLLLQHNLIPCIAAPTGNIISLWIFQPSPYNDGLKKTKNLGS